MFIGEYKHSLDVKNRLAVPSKFKEELLGGAVVTKGFDKCLYLYPAKEWEKQAMRLASLPSTQSKARAIARLQLAGAMDVELDGQRRIMLPEFLKEYAGIGKNVVLAGLYDRLEIWDEAEWKKYKSVNDANSESIAETMGEFGI